MIFSLISCLKIKIFNIDVNLVTCDLINLYLAGLLIYILYFTPELRSELEDLKKASLVSNVNPN